MTVLLTERQQMAAALAREFDKLSGVWVVSPLPLDNNRKLRVQILDSVRNSVIQTIRDWGHDLVCVSVQPRIVPGGPEAACVWEIDLPREQVPVQDRTIHGEIAKPETSNAEREK